MRFEAGLALSIVAAGCGLAQPRTEPPALQPGETYARELAAGALQEHFVDLRAGQYARIEIAQQTVDVAAAVFDPAGKQILAADEYPIGDAEAVELIAATSGRYRLRVRASEPRAPAGVYQIALAEVSAAADRHRTRIAAAREGAQAAAANRRGTREAMLEAVRHYEAARLEWRAAADPAAEARVLYTTAFIYIELGEREQALAHATAALPLARAANNGQLLGRVLDCIGEVHNNFSDKKTAMGYYLQALPLLRTACDQAGEGRTLSNLAVAYTGTGEKRKALELFEQALQVLRPLQDRATLATVAGNIGVTYDNLGDYQRSLESHQYALTLRRELENRPDEALTQNNIGSAYSGLGDYQKALDAYHAALEINRAYDSRWNMAVNLNNIGWVHAMLGDRRQALASYQESLKLSRAIQDRRRIAVALNNIANIHAELADYRKAIELHTEALALRRQTSDPDGEATSLTNLGEAYTKLGETEKARGDFERAVEILRVSVNRHKLVRALRGLGALSRSTGDHGRSRACLDEALALSREIHDQNGEASVLAELARLEYAGGQLLAARQFSEQSLAAFESLRLRVVSPNLRASLVASARQVHELTIEILEKLHAQQPDAGFDAEAFRVAETGRARSLLELLGESGMEIRRGADTALVARERELQRRIADRAERRTQMSSRKHTAEEEAAAARELDALGSELEQVQSRIRETSPQYAALTRPAVLSLREIQTRVLDEHTVLLEYELGAEKSFLWAVSPASIASFELRPRAEIESAARRMYELLTARNVSLPGETPAARSDRVRQADGNFYPAAAELSRMLLAPAAAQIAGKRLVVVAEGALEYLPFGALPEPGKQAPLMVDHEVVTAPSASVLSVLRQETRGREPAPKKLFIAADPVYSANDPRVGQHRLAAGAQRGAEEFMRLRFSRTEAEQIASLAGPAGAVKAFDFDASRDAVLQGGLAQFQMVHFAAHSLIDDERPELSGIVLSQVDRQGRRQNGFLRLYDIYNLRLNAGLVVLSACRTAMGKEIKGEGLIGLARGFFYAGAPRVLATLWKIDDRTGAAFMKPFYQAMMLRGERPAAALRSAQIELWKTRGWDAPYYWAAFVMQGEWQ